MLFNKEHKRIIENIETTIKPTQNADLMLHYIRKSYDENIHLVDNSLYSSNYFVSNLINIIEQKEIYNRNIFDSLEPEYIKDENGNIKTSIDHIIEAIPASSYDKFFSLTLNLTIINPGFEFEIDINILKRLCLDLSNSAGEVFPGNKNIRDFFILFDIRFNEFLEDKNFIEKYVEDKIHSDGKYDDLIYKKYREYRLLDKLEKKEETKINPRKKI